MIDGSEETNAPEDDWWQKSLHAMTDDEILALYHYAGQYSENDTNELTAILGEDFSLSKGAKSLDYLVTRIQGTAVELYTSYASATSDSDIYTIVTLLDGQAALIENSCGETNVLGRFDAGNEIAISDMITPIAEHYGVYGDDENIGFRQDA